MAIARPSLQRTILQMDLNRFYEKPVTRVSVALVLSLLCIAFFAIAAIRPTLETMAVLLKQIDEKKALDVQLTQKITALTTAQRQLTIKETLFPIIGIAVPDSADFTTLLKAIEKLGAEHQITLKAIQADKVPLEVPLPKTASTVKLVSHPMTLSFTGDYTNLVAFMHDVGALKRIMTIDQFTISPDTGEESTTLTLSLSIRAFSFQSKGKQISGDSL